MDTLKYEYYFRIESTNIENGFDYILKSSAKELQIDLKYLVNNKMPSDKKEEIINNEDNTQVTLPKSDEDLIKHLTGVDLKKVRKNRDFTSSIDANVVVSKDNRLKLRFPISEFETFDENYVRAKQYFNNAIFVFKQGTKTRYVLNPGIDLSNYIKVVCSTDVGDTPRSEQVFESYRDSKKRPRQNASETGRYAEWSLKQEGVKQILNSKSGFIDLTDIIDTIKNGKLEEVEEKLARIQPSIQTQQIKQKLDELKTGNTSPNMQAYLNIIKLINSIVVTKKVTKNKVNYFLQANSTNTNSTEYDDLYSELLRQIKLWTTVESPEWQAAFIEKAKELIKLFQRAN
jgi:hypothetical protein